MEQKAGSRLTQTHCRVSALQSSCKTQEAENRGREPHQLPFTPTGQGKLTEKFKNISPKHKPETANSPETYFA